MFTPLLATKLYIPPPRPQVVLRTRLIERLNEGLHHKLTVISAPAGFGKTTLVSEWIACCNRPTAWLSLDKEDNDTVRFINYLIASLQTLVPNTGSGILGLLQTSQLPPIESILTNLLNEIATFQNHFTLVLDDYHEIDSKPIDQAITFLLEHQPAQMHLVITTREDPNLPLTRLRVRDQLTELRTADLRFTPSEATEFLNKVMGLDLSEENISALEARTEGWIGGLQLAALTMQGHQDVSGFVQAFSGDHRYIVDYLVEEVLQHQPESLRSFLLQTSILTRLNGSLCDAVTGQNGGKERLATLQRGNFFLIPLDDKRHWYRYHHLFADVLLVNLMTEQPDLVSTLHKRASEWYVQNGSVSDAIRHAMAANDYARAADLLELNIKELLQSRQETAVLSWLKELPEELVQYRPVLCNWYAGSLLTSGKMAGVDYWLSAAEKWQDLVANIDEKSESLVTKMIVNNEAEFRRLPGAIAIHRAGQALMLGNVDDTMKFARRVLELARNEDDFLCGAASALLGLALWTSGDLETAHQMFAEGMAYLQKIGYITDVIGGSVTLADIRITQGQLRAAMSIYERGLQLATKQGMPILRGAADMHVGMSEFYRERNDLHSAMQHLEKCKELGELNGLPKNPYRWRVAIAGIREVQGNLQEALVLLDEAEPLYAGDFSPNVRPIQTLKARVWIKQGELEKALAWARERKLSVEEDPSYLREFEQITFVRILLFQYQSDHSDRVLHDAIDLLERLLRAADEGGRMGSVIEILVLQALAYQMKEDILTAVTLLERALKLAEPEDYMRIFLAEGSSMAKLMRKVDARGFLPSYTRKLLSAFEEDQQGMEEETAPTTSPASSSLIEPLSHRELDILRLFKTELSGPEIAQEYVIALSTVRSHTKSIYSKLNVNSRRGAVKRAIELGLI